MVEGCEGGNDPIEELVDIEEFVRSGRPVPHARRYKYRVNKKHYVSETPELTREQILERADFVPVTKYRLLLKRRHGAPEEIKPGQTVHLRLHGIERFIAQDQEVQDGLDEARRQFSLPEDDVNFLDTLGLRWETIRDGGVLWLIVYDMPIPAGYSVEAVDTAIQITPGYPTSPLDMAYFHPALARADGVAINRANVSQPLDGKSWQRWSRHRTAASAWVAGQDNIERHIAYIRSWLLREFGL